MSCIKKSFRKIGVLVVVTLSSFVCYAKANPASNLSDDKQITKNIELHKLKYIDYLEEKKRFAFISVTDDLLNHGGRSIGAFFLSRAEQNHTDPVSAEYKNNYYRIEGRDYEIFIAKSGLSDSDFVYVFDKDSKQLKSFALNELNAIAIISPDHTIEDSGPYFESDFIFGFEIDADKLKNFTNPLVYIGKENPFSH